VLGPIALAEGERHRGNSVLLALARMYRWALFACCGFGHQRHLDDLARREIRNGKGMTLDAFHAAIVISSAPCCSA
jgi:hypothetical protein